MKRQSTLPGINVASHSNRGLEWEEQLQATHHWYRLQGWADIVKNPSEWIFVGEKEYLRRFEHDPGAVAVTGNNRYMRRVPSDVDYSGGGFFAGRHFSILFDAKTTSRVPAPLGLFKDHQIARLRESARCGTIAGFLLLLSAIDRVFWIPYAVIARKEEEYLRARIGRRARPGTASFSLEELEKTCPEIRRNPRNGLWDYLPVLLDT